jgi:hypothetical protein
MGKTKDNVHPNDVNDDIGAEIFISFLCLVNDFVLCFGVSSSSGALSCRLSV